LHSFLFWAPLLAVALPLPVVLVAREREARASSRVAWVVALPGALVMLWGLFVLAGGASLPDAVLDRGGNWVTAAFFAAGLCVCLLALWQTLAQRGEDDDRGLLVPVLTMMATALLLILGAELFYIDDLFGSRLNSVFKLYYQAWLLLGVSAAAGGFWVTQLWQRPSATATPLRGAWSGVAALILLGALLYPLGATLSRTQGLARQPRTLDGLAYARQSAQGEYALADWLRRRAGPGEYLVEATGEAYTDASRVSAWSGVPGVLGWPGHEVQWGRDGLHLNSRRQDVDEAYSSLSLAGALAILQKYDVTYVVVGSRERQKYPAGGLEKFAGGLPEVLRAGQAVLYRIPRGAQQGEPEVKVAP
jgi:uncharacterized membrane protein